MEKLLMAWSLAWLFVAAWVISGYAADGYALRRKYNQLLKENSETNDDLSIALDIMTDKEAKQYQEEGHFQQGSMWPKIRSAIHFLKHHGKKVIITNIDSLQDAIDGKAGTTIIKK